eukprot:CAMPEP_0197715988 /NCGR_PEP_ID=MMETSP1434-20131217/1035_1 /TAXON_ID=265543 /ORGANISM="Minutocellus polymorphus, Strain CCMP3303" /LENGTH=53 /DNA_ID=CAMNT_0043300265 /DNA_START=39 /DNA_END=200 /DNA_ORIENTATION=+
MTDPLPVPAQLEAQLGKCRSVRNDTFRKGRDKTPQEIEEAKSKLAPLPAVEKK